MSCAHGVHQSATQHAHSTIVHRHANNTAITIIPNIPLILLQFVAVLWRNEEPAPALKMDKSAIVPELIDDYGTTELRVMYAGQSAPLQFGQQLPTADVKTAPQVSWPTATTTEQLYTLAMIDPDAPSQRWPFLGEVLHWLVMNVPGDRIADGDTLFAYIPSGPPPFTGLHRYVFLVFAQPNGRIECVDEKPTNVM